MATIGTHSEDTRPIPTSGPGFLEHTSSSASDSYETLPKFSKIPSAEGIPSEDDYHKSAGVRSNAQPNSSSISEPVMDDKEAKTVGTAQFMAPSAPKGEGVSHQRQEIVQIRRRNSDVHSVAPQPSHDNVHRLSAAEMQALTNSPKSLPVAPAPPKHASSTQEQMFSAADQPGALEPKLSIQSSGSQQPTGLAIEGHDNVGLQQLRDRVARTSQGSRTVSNPPTTRTPFSLPSPTEAPHRRNSLQPTVRPPRAQSTDKGDGSALLGSPPISAASSSVGLNVPFPRDSPGDANPHFGSSLSSNIPVVIPLPPMSLPTHLQLELAAQRPSPLYIHQAPSNEVPYESSAAKFERLKNVLLLPPYLERTLHFGALACLDAWLYNFTILPIRFTLAVTVLAKWWGYIIMKEGRWLVGYVWDGLGRLWERGRTGRFRRPSDGSERPRSRSRSDVSGASTELGTSATTTAGRQHSRRPKRASDRGHLRSLFQSTPTSRPNSGTFRHRRTKSEPSKLSTFHKADLLQGALILCSSLALMTLDASRMYHFIRAQSAIKLYVIYNILEVGDRLLSAIGQDILECLFSHETLSRNDFGRSKVLLPFGMFILSLAYNCLHSVALYYQVITLNVAVNSYSNALLTLVLSNQFVEIKGTVFKRIEKDNLFQLTCADIVERFHLWIMLLIIGMRNVVEVGGLSVPGAGTWDEGPGQPGMHTPSILPHSFTILPSWLISGEVLSPFLIVIGSETLVDTIKHAYVTKFNNIKPTFYSRILDILCKDHYTNSFTTPSLTRRLGVAVIPLSCLFIRASIQTYHMFLSTHLPMPVAQSTQTSLSDAEPSSAAMMAALNRFDSLIRASLGRATYGYPYGSPLNSRSWYSWTSDDLIAAVTMIVFFFIIFLVLLMLKLLLGMVLLQYSRNRYAKMKHKEHLIATGKMEKDSYDTKGKRSGGLGHIEVGEDRQRWIHSDKTEGLRSRKVSEARRVGSEDRAKANMDFSSIHRYEMVAKRIW